MRKWKWREKGMECGHKTRRMIQKNNIWNFLFSLKRRSILETLFSNLTVHHSMPPKYIGIEIWENGKDRFKRIKKFKPLFEHLIKKFLVVLSQSTPHQVVMIAREVEQQKYAHQKFQAEYQLKESQHCPNQHREEIVLLKHFYEVHAK